MSSSNRRATSVDSFVSVVVLLIIGLSTVIAVAESNFEKDLLRQRSSEADLAEEMTLRDEVLADVDKVGMIELYQNGDSDRYRESTYTVDMDKALVTRSASLVRVSLFIYLDIVSPRTR